MTDNLRSYAHDYFSPYITVKYGTGEWFLTLMWRKYHLEMPEHADPLTRLRTDRHPDIDMDLPMFTSGRGLIWEPWDKEMFLWIANHPLLTGLLVTAAAACVVVFLARWCPAFHRGTRGYTAVGNQFHVEGGKAD